MKKSIILILLLGFNIMLFSQNLRISHYTVNQGLSQSVVYSLFQDSRGFIWIGTQDGLNRFDGYDFVKFFHMPSDTNSLPSSWVYTINEDKNGDLWIGTRAGLCKYVYSENLFVRYPNKLMQNNELYRDNVLGIDVSLSGKIYTNTPPFINCFDPETEKFTSHQNSIALDPKIEEYSLPLLIDKEGIVWSATTLGLVQFNPETQEFKNFVHDSENTSTISDNIILSIFEDKNGLIWIGNTRGIDIYNKELTIFYRNPIENNNSPILIRSIVQDEKGYYYAASANGLLKLEYENGKIKLTSQIGSSSEITTTHLNNSFVNALLIDNSHNLWIGTLNGLDKTDLKDPKFKLYRKSSEASSFNMLDNVIASIYKDKDENIWVGNWGKGLNIIDRETGKVKHYSSGLSGINNIPNDFVHVIFEFSPNEIWIGTRNGIFVFDKNKFVNLKEFYKADKIPDFTNNRIVCMIKDKLNNVWVGTQGGLYYLDINNNTYQFYSSNDEPPKKISDNLIYSLIFDHNDNLWIATMNGLNKYNYSTGEFTIYVRDEKSKNSINDNYVVSLCLGSDSILWIGTKSGITQLDLVKNEFKYLSETDGLNSSTVYEIIEDDLGNMWFATGKGLSQLKKGENELITYSEEDGLQSIEFNLRASYKSKDGEIFFGGMNGFNSFYPKNFSENRNIPEIQFTSFQKQNKNGTEDIYITNKNKIVLTHEDFALNVEFAALEFTSSNKNKYAYKLDGASQEWIEIGNRRFLTFSKLSPGTYNLWIKGSNNDEIWNEKGTYIVIKVLPPWWRSTVAYIAYLFFIITAIILYIKYRERKLQEQKRVLEIKVKERTEEVEKQKNEIIYKNEELEQQNQEILAQRDTLSMQNEKISKQNKQIKDSILYASRIQSAILPSPSVLNKINIDHFLIYRPKHIVSGDFYWIKQINNHLLIAVADCTGHGVPGAFMSMLGNAFLNEIVNHSEINHANLVLEKLRELTISSLGQSGDETITKDGMDISFCEINLDTLIMQFAGAYNPLLIVSEGNLLEFKADRFPVGSHYRGQQPFTNTEIQLKRGDVIYMLTDGIVDQFGGETDIKFTLRRLKSLLPDIYDLPLHIQKSFIDGTIEDWMKYKYEQTDDITILGLKIN